MPTVSTRPSASERNTHGRPTWYHRKQRIIEADIQLLLDAQAEGLAGGPDPHPHTPTTESVSDPLASGASTPSLSSTQILQPRNNGKVSLRDARRGLYSAMRRLALLKAEEAKDIDMSAEVAFASVEQLQAWKERRSKLLDRVGVIDSGPEAQRAIELRQQAEHLQPEIHELEMKLAELRNQQRRLRKEASDVETRVQTKLSSYTRNLDVLEKEIKDFLRDMQPSEASSTMFSNDATEEEPFWTLPIKRRTLDMALEISTKEKDAVESRQDLVETEREALEEGAVVWRDVLRDVEAFERLLKVELGSTPPSDGVRGRQKSPSNQSHSDLLKTMAETIKLVESKLRLAEARGWKLLIAAIGAELDAFKQGKAVLEDMLGVTEPSNVHSLPDNTTNGNVYDGDVGSSTNVGSPFKEGSTLSKAGDAIHDLDHHFERATVHEHNDHDSYDEDDGPDPELLISHQEE